MGWRGDVALMRDRIGYLVRSKVVVAVAFMGVESDPFDVCRLPGEAAIGTGFDEEMGFWWYWLVFRLLLFGVAFVLFLSLGLSLSFWGCWHTQGLRLVCCSSVSQGL